MSVNDPWAVVTGRFEAQDKRIDALDASQHDLEEDVSTFKATVALLHQEVTRMTESFKTMRTALYCTATIIMGAAILLVLLGGRHP